MPKYTCKNKDCYKFEVVQINDTKIGLKNGEKYDTGSICPYCEGTMERDDPEGNTTMMHGSDNICRK